MDQVLQSQDVGRVRFLTIERPRQLNALNSAVVARLIEEVSTAADDQSVGCLVLQGAGERAFCAGADLDELESLQITQAHTYLKSGHDLMRRIGTSPVPVLAAVDGYALGGGFELALSCHLVLASSRSMFGLPESKIGCIPGLGGTQRLMDRAPKPFAMRAMLTGESFTAAVAFQMGLLSEEPLDAEQFETRVTELAATLASRSRTSQEFILRLTSDQEDAQRLGLEASYAAMALASSDGREGIASFHQRRSPVFNTIPR